MDATNTIAWIGAITGSIGTLTGVSALLWDLYKWKHSGAKLKVTASPGMALVNVPNIGPNERFISVTVTNSGQSKTTVTTLGFFYFESDPNRKLEKATPTQQMVVVDQGFGQQLPHVLEPGGQWTGLARQSKEVERMARTGYLYAVISHTLSEQPVFARVIMKDAAVTPRQL